MNIALGKEQAEWLQARVADGTFGSLDEAVALIVAERMVLEDDSLEWVGPLLDEARHDVTAGRTMTLDEHRARNADRQARLGG
jgi:Arc/MetJ-type ribon-helix-helix transcriptional regulator